MVLKAKQRSLAFDSKRVPIMSLATIWTTLLVLIVFLAISTALFTRFYLYRQAQSLGIPFLEFMKRFINRDGELFVSLEIVSLGHEYIDASDVTLPAGINDTTQIDHIVFSPYGIFVIETKTLSGYIYGKENEKQWTQSFKNGKTFTFQNPFRQNYKHIKTIERELHKQRLDIPVHSVVVLAGEGSFRSGDIDGLCYLSELKPFMRSFNRNIIPARDVASAIRAVMRIAIKPGEETNQIHINNLKARFN